MKISKIIGSVLFELFVLILSAFLFALSFPNFISLFGFFPIAYFCLIPVFIIIHRASWLKISFYGFIFGFASYALFSYWLYYYHPLAFLIIPILFGLYFFVLFPLFKLVDTAFPDYGYILATIIWCAYEYLRTTGFLGLPYGIIAYTQYPFLPLIRISSITGVWGIVLIVVFPSIFLAYGLKDGITNLKPFIKKNTKAIAVYATVFLLIIVYGIFGTVDLKESKRDWKVALIQQNIDPWQGGYANYEKTLDILIRLSKEALKYNPEIVIWSETSFVPAIDYHTRYRENPEAREIVNRLIDFLDTQTVPYVIGNDDGVKINAGTPLETRLDYNASILYKDKRIVDTYRKMRLVPFTESFPYKETFSRMHNFLIENKSTFWEKGSAYTIYETDGVKFCTPICFEDTFGYLNSRFVDKGVEVIVNMTNDGWSKSVVCEVQHMTMAVFRAVENKRSVVRSSNSGITCIIDPNGRIKKQLLPFTEGFLIADVPVYTKEKTFYTAHRDWLAVLCLFVSVVGIIAAIVTMVKQRFLHKSMNPL